MHVRFGPCTVRVLARGDPNIQAGADPLQRGGSDTGLLEHVRRGGRVPAASTVSC